jgi:hypothetical protein
VLVVLPSSPYIGGFCTITWKHPSASINPLNQFGSFISAASTNGLVAGITPRKDSLNFSDKPQFSEALYSLVLVYPLWLNVVYTACLNKI